MSSIGKKPTWRSAIRKRCQIHPLVGEESPSRELSSGETSEDQQEWEFFRAESDRVLTDASDPARDRIGCEQQPSSEAGPVLSQSRPRGEGSRNT